MSNTVTDDIQTDYENISPTKNDIKPVFPSHSHTIFEKARDNNAIGKSIFLIILFLGQKKTKTVQFILEDFCLRIWFLCSINKQ